MDENHQDQLLELLKSQHRWPGIYKFKFIAPADSIHVVIDYFSGDVVHQRSSQSGKYISVTVDKYLMKAEDVIVIYSEVQKFEGVICL